MPNYCSNKCAFLGKESEVKRLLDLIKSEESEFDFNKVIPMPEDLDIDSVSNPSPELQAKYDANLEKYGYKDWYDWQVDNWGCKWGADNIEIVPDGDEITVTFITPWAPPIPIYDALAKMFPELTMGYAYAETGCCFYGLGLKRPGEEYFDEVEIEDGSKEMWKILEELGYAVYKGEDGEWHWEEEEEEE